jgi:thiamine-phosphate pyrophosphorylase
VKRLSDCHLYTFVDTACLAGRDPLVVARQLCEGGSDILQLRAKDKSIDEVHRLAEQLLPITAKAGVPLVINDFPAVARILGAPFAHLGQEDFFDAGHRHVSCFSTGDRKLGIGLSTHSPKQAERALRAEPDYIAIGPVFATPTKPGRPPATLEYVRWAAQHVSIPWFAIGGITLANLDEVLDAGATRVCVVRAVLDAPDIVRACRAFKERLRSAPRQS